jgi:hypothetical protein
MTAITVPTTAVGTETQADAQVKVTRRRIDHLLVGTGVAVTAVLLLAGALLTWGSTFARDYVHDELTAQHIAFPEAAALEEEGRGDLVQYAGETVDTGTEAEAYAGYIAGHVDEIGGGKTYAELGTDQFAAEAALTEAIDNGAPQAQVDELQATYDGIVGQRDTMFKGEVLRGTLLNTYAWDTVGQIAGYAAVVAFAGGAVMFVLVGLGMVHLRRMKHHNA